MEMKIVAAMCNENRGAGLNDGNLPWPCIQEDEEYYLSLIKKKHDPDKKILTIQGRKTWQKGNLGRKEDPGAIQIVISRNYDSNKDPYHPIVVSSFDEAAQVAMTPEMQSQVESVWIMGGQRVWEEAVEHPLCKWIYLTRIYKEFDSDVFFPPFEDKFKMASDPEVDPKVREDNGIRFQFLVYERK